MTANPYLSQQQQQQQVVDADAIVAQELARTSQQIQTQSQGFNPQSRTSSVKGRGKKTPSNTSGSPSKRDEYYAMLNSPRRTSADISGTRSRLMDYLQDGDQATAVALSRVEVAAQTRQELLNESSVVVTTVSFIDLYHNPMEGDSNKKKKGANINDNI